MSSATDYVNEDDFIGEYYECLTKVLATVQVTFIQNELAQDVDLSKPPQPVYPDNESVSNCPLHVWLAKGGIGYTPRVDGSYSMYAPECNGCTHGIHEKKKLEIKSENEKEAVKKFNDSWIEKYGRLPKGVN